MSISNHYLYGTWESMKQRCLNKNKDNYHRYGGRGISICNDWLQASKYIEYVETNLGHRPSPNHTIDRIDNDKDYEPGNIRWATRKEQSANTRVRSDNRVGVKGVSFDNTRNKWVVRLTVDGSYKYIGRFNSELEAIKVARSYTIK